MSLSIDLRVLERRRIQRFRERIRVAFRGKVLFDVPMREKTTIRIGGPAEVLAFPCDEEDLRVLLWAARKEGLPWYVIGRGSNLLVRDGGIRGVVIDLSEGFQGLSVVGEDRVVADAGVALRTLVSFAEEKGLKGLEFALGIPGSVGGAIAMNAGAYGHEIGRLLEWMEVMTEDGEIVRIDKGSLSPSYRSLSFTPRGVILRGMFDLEKGRTWEIEAKMEEFRRRRGMTQGVSLPSAGSVFKNPPGLSAGRLIDEIGLKGLRIGDAMVSPVHGNYIVNCGKAKAKDVLTLIDKIRERVLAERGIFLELEIRVVGKDDLQGA